MNKKGFTLVELLATLVVIAIVMGIVLPSAVRISHENKDKMLEQYKKVIEEYALVSPLRGQERIDINDLDVIQKIKKECTGYAQLIPGNVIQYEAHIECNIINTHTS